MKKTCSLFLFFIAICIAVETNAQGGKLGQLRDRMKQKIDQRTNTRTDKAMDKSLDGVEKSIDGDGKEKTATADDDKTAAAEKKTSEAGIKSYSKFDFVPGDKIIYVEDFAGDNIGELPLKWNTNGSGELVELDGVEGKWLEMKQESKYTSPMKTKMPENYTVEFDMVIEFKSDQRVADIEVFISKPLGVNGSGGEGVEISSGIHLSLMPNGGQGGEPDAVSLNTFDGKGQKFYASENKMLTSEFTRLNKKGVPIHVALWAQGSRLRVWLNQKKMYDLPKALSKDAVPTNISFSIGSYGGPQNNYHYYVSNIKAAIASPDNRSKLITEGKWATSGIKFDVNSDEIKSESYGVLKDIAAVLNENPTVKVKIIGHTDSDGDDANNMELSKKRAAAVKKMLASEFKIDASRMETDGLGETKPVADNSKPEGKAQNRRVEFVKM